VIVADTNLLVYAHRAALPEHRPARAVLERANRASGGWAITLSSVLEFWSVVTHLSASGRPSRIDEARAFIDALVDAGARLLIPGPGSGQRVLDTAAQMGIVGPRIFDLHIALTALDHGGTELWSHDSAFVSLPGLRLVDPLG
jgi:toxin-antitoxin system PIN domain toxin